MILVIVAFVTADVAISVGLRRFLMQRDFSWLGGITAYFYNITTGALYLDMALNNDFLLIHDVTELHSKYGPALFTLCFFMVFFHCWAFPKEGRK